MSSTDGDKEAPLASTRVRSGKVDATRQYSSSWVKWLVDRLFPARPLKLDGDRLGTAPTHK
jgi:hypothetical protein